MGTFTLGSLSSVPASARPDLLAATTQSFAAKHGWLDMIGVVEIDPALSETAATQETYGLEPGHAGQLCGGRRQA